MSEQFLTFAALSKLKVEELRDIAQLIEGPDRFVPMDKDIITRGIIMPFLRDAVDDKDGSKDQVLQAALVRAAETLGIKRKDWSTTQDTEIIDRIREEWALRYRQRLDQLDEKDRQRIIDEAQKAHAARAREAGLAGSTAAGIVVAEASGFGIYMATTSTIAALGHAVGVVFPFAVYQGATTTLGVVLGPIGWVAAGATVVTTVALKWKADQKSQSVRLQMVMIGLILGLAPWLWFEIPVSAGRKDVDTKFRAITKCLHPDTISEHVPVWMRATMVEWFLTGVEYKKRIIASLEDGEQ